MEKGRERSRAQNQRRPSTIGERSCPFPPPPSLALPWRGLCRRRAAGLFPAISCLARPRSRPLGRQCSERRRGDMRVNSSPFLVGAFVAGGQASPLRLKQRPPPRPPATRSTSTSRRGSPSPSASPASPSRSRTTRRGDPWTAPRASSRGWASRRGSGPGTSSSRGRGRRRRRRRSELERPAARAAAAATAAARPRRARNSSAGPASSRSPRRASQPRGTSTSRRPSSPRGGPFRTAARSGGTTRAGPTGVRKSFCFMFFFFFCFEEKQKTHVSLSHSTSLFKKKKKKNFKGVAADVAPVSGNNSEQQQNRLPGLARAPPPAESARAAASLLLRLDALAASRNNNVLLPPGSAPLLRALARAGDGPLLSAYERCRSWTDDAAVASELARAAGLRFSNTSSSSSSSSGRNNNNRPLHVVHVASEAAPFAKVGGLADVVCALSRSNQSGGTHVELVLPKYDCGDYGSLSELRELGRISVPWGGGGSGNGTAKRGVPTAVWGALCSGLPTYLLEPLEPLSPHSSSLPPPFWRGQAYGAPDDAERFLFFAVAALEFLLWAGRSPDAIHCHDWQSASVPLLLEAGGYRRKRAATFGGGLGFFGLGGGGDGGGDQGREGGGVSSSPTAGDGPLATTGTVLTIHNLAFPGRMNPSVLSPAVSGERMERGLEGREKWKRKRESRERERKKKKLNLFFAQKNNSKKQNTNKKTLNHRSSPLGSLEPRVPQLGLRRRPRPGRAQGPPRRARRPAPEGRGGPRGRHDDCLSHLFPRSVV